MTRCESLRIEISIELSDEARPEGNINESISTIEGKVSKIYNFCGLSPKLWLGQES